MTIPQFFYSNINTLSTLLDENTSLHESLEASPFSSSISRRGSFWGRTYSCLWLGMNAADENLSQRQLNAAISRTMSLFCYVLQDMIYTQNLYLRLLKANVNGVHFDTADLENCRSKLKGIYENIGPFIHRLRKSQSPVGKELLTLLREDPEEEIDVTRLFKEELLTKVNKQIGAIIHLECIYGELLPYNQLLWGMYTDEPIPTQKTREIITSLGSQVDFKVTYRALHLIHTLSDIDQDFHLTLYYLYKKNIPVIHYPERKLDTWRRSLKPGDVIMRNNSSPMILGKRLGTPKQGYDGRIAFQLQSNLRSVVVFYPNKAYYDFRNIRAGKEACAAKPIPTIVKDEKLRWSTELYIDCQPLSLSNLLEFIDHLFIFGPITVIDFTEILHNQSTGLLSTLRPIFPENENFDGFVDSLMKLYDTGYYGKDCSTLYEFLQMCLKNAQEKHLQFFKELALDTAKLPIDTLQNEITFVIDTAVGKKQLISPSSYGDEKTFFKKCQTMVLEIIERRALMVQKLRSQSSYSEDQEILLLNDFIKTIPEKVCTWILPPQ